MPCNYLTKITRKDRKGRSLYKPRHKTWGPVTFSEAPLLGILQQNFPPAPLQFGCSKGGHLVLMQKTSNLTTFQHLQRGAKMVPKGYQFSIPFRIKDIPPRMEGVQVCSSCFVFFVGGVLKTFLDPMTQVWSFGKPGPNDVRNLIFWYWMNI